VIENVEHLGAKLQLQRLVNPKAPMDGEIPLRGAETSQGIAREGSLPKRITSRRINRRICESGWIEPPPPGTFWYIEGLSTLWPVQIKGLSWNYIRSNIGLNNSVEREKIGIRDVNGGSGSSHNDTIERPPLQSDFCQGVDCWSRDVIGYPYIKRMSKSEGPRF
jgi:hypothetical protein